MREKLKSGLLQTVLKGMFVGGTMLVPGVSGGSMAMILGIYDKLIKSVSSFRKKIKDNLLFLIIFAVGGFTGMLLFAKPIDYLIRMFTKPMLYFFTGAVMGGIPMIYKKAGIERISVRIICYLLGGAMVVTLLSMIPAGGYVGMDGFTGLVSLMLAGIVAAVALVLPGISVSYMFLVLGIYDRVIGSIKEFDLSVLLPLGIGGLLGIALTTKLLDIAMSRFPGASYMIILGFILGSVAEIFPGRPDGIGWLICPLMFMGGWFIIRVISSQESEAKFERN